MIRQKARWLLVGLLWLALWPAPVQSQSAALKEEDMTDDKTMPITGGCMCGAVRYEATEPPQEVGYCHCRMCQKATGNLFYPYAMFRGAAFRITQGEPKFYKSSALVERGFCANCGTQVCDHYFKGVDHMFASIGSLDHPEDWPPNEHVGIESQVPWLVIHDDLPRMRTDEDPYFVAAKAAVEQGED